MEHGKESRKAARDWRVRTGIVISLLLLLGLFLTFIASMIRDIAIGAPIADSKDLIGPLLTGTGVLTAVLAFRRDRKKIAAERAAAMSKTLYEQAKAGLDDVCELLSDQNNDRATWVRAARVLETSRQLGERITSSDYVAAYAVAEARARARLHEILSLKGEAGQRNPLPPAFFFGHPQWKTCTSTLDEIAKETSPRTQVHSVSEATVIPDPSLKSLAGRSVVSIMGMLEFPKEFDDPLDKVLQDADKNWPTDRGPLQGAKRFLDHQRGFTAMNEKLIARTSSANQQGADSVT